MVRKKQLKEANDFLTDLLCDSMANVLELEEKLLNMKRDLIIEKERREYLTDALDTITLGMFSHIIKQEEVSDEVIEGIVKSVQEQL